ncbi:MAG TPA: zeta toxin family protein [Puia sp.]|jgi:predicted ABC-type ATPase|nr:zeta toxin family protein [Puia sp.]
MPVLYLLAGPNGSGKTTFYSTAVQNDFIDKNLPFINVDMIAQSIGGYNEKNYFRASEIYRETVKKYFDEGADFMIESNLADSRSYEWITLIKSKKYNVILYYLSTDDLMINVGRVERRVAEGGHNIPEEIIKTRYFQSHSYLKTKLSEFQEVYLIDNSTDIPQVQIKLMNGVIVDKVDNLQNWVKDVISIIERLQNR